MKIVSVVSQKGGGGKTTAALHLSVVAGQKGKKVALVDNDHPQHSAAVWHQGRQADQPLLAKATMEDLPALVNQARSDGLDLLIIDTSPHNDEAAVAAAKLADLIIIPCRPGPLDLAAVGATIRVCAHSKKPYAVLLNACPMVRRVLGKEREAAIVREARTVIEQQYKARTVPQQLTQLAAYSHALIGGEAVTEFEPYGRAAEEIGRLWEWTEGELYNGN